MPRSNATLPSGVVVCAVVKEVRTTRGDVFMIADVAALKITSGMFACFRSGVIAMASGVK